MKEKPDFQRRNILKAAGAAMLTSAFAPAGLAAQPTAGSHLQVWSCGGLAEAFRPANKRYAEITGVQISYTGAFAAALGKSLLGSAETEVFAGRVLKLAQELRAADKMVYFKPLCFSNYVLVTPRGNPAGIASITDLCRKGVRVALSPDASPPGGAAVLKLLENARIQEDVLANTTLKSSCVHRMIDDVTAGRADAAIVENRITRLPAVAGKLEIFNIPENIQPPPPRTFTIGVMQAAENRKTADAYVAFILSSEGQAFFENAGFIPAISDKGKELTEKFGVKDV